MAPAVTRGRRVLRRADRSPRRDRGGAAEVPRQCALRPRVPDNGHERRSFRGRRRGQLAGKIETLTQRGEMDVAVDQTGQQGETRCVDRLGVARHLGFAPAAGFGDSPVLDDDDRVGRCLAGSRIQQRVGGDRADHEAMLEPGSPRSAGAPRGSHLTYTSRPPRRPHRATDPLSRNAWLTKLVTSLGNAGRGTRRTSERARPSHGRKTVGGGEATTKHAHLIRPTDGRPEVLDAAPGAAPPQRLRPRVVALELRS